MVDTQPEELLVFSLGPVQSFISAARRTEDLWTGSQLLSALATAGIREAEQRLSDADHFVYPTKVDGEWPQDIPNRFVLAVPEGQGELLGEAIEQAVQSAWFQIATQVRDSFFKRMVSRKGWESLWERQIADWLEIYWVAFPETEGNYGQRYRDAGLALASRKSVRSFPRGPESGEKCTLCGMREALPGNEGTRRDLREFWDGVRQSLERLTIFSLREGEHLCAVCTVKRFAAAAGIRLAGDALRPKERFPSTSSIAVATFKAHVLKHWHLLSEAAERHLKALAALSTQTGAPFGEPEAFPHLQHLADGIPEAERLMCYEGSYFYLDTLRFDNLSDVLGREPEPKDQMLAAAAQGTLTQLVDQMHQVALPSPHTYLAVLALDGDRMGALMSSCDSPEQHREISRALVKYARFTVPDIVESRYAGRVVYAGGDDILALLPVGHVLQAADDLRKGLTEALGETGIKDQTASAGVAIIHHGQSLENALQRARRAEHVAKQAYGRNALVLDLLRRSGERTEAGLNWTYGGLVRAALAPIADIQDAFTHQELSSRFAYELREEAAALAGVPKSQESEIRRLLSRHWLAKTDAQSQERIASLARDLSALAGVDRVGIESLAEWLLVARFLSQGGGEV